MESILNRFQFESPDTIMRRKIKNNINILLYPSCKMIDITRDCDIDNGFIEFEIIGRKIEIIKIII
jgi:hypothetical protein